MRDASCADAAHRRGIGRCGHATARRRRSGTRHVTPRAAARDRCTDCRSAAMSRSRRYSLDASRTVASRRSVAVTGPGTSRPAAADGQAARRERDDADASARRAVQSTAIVACAAWSTRRAREHAATACVEHAREQSAAVALDDARVTTHAPRRVHVAVPHQVTTVAGRCELRRPCGRPCAQRTERASPSSDRRVRDSSQHEHDLATERAIVPRLALHLIGRGDAEQREAVAQRRLDRGDEREPRARAVAGSSHEHAQRRRRRCRRCTSARSRRRARAGSGRSRAARTRPPARTTTSGKSSSRRATAHSASVVSCAKSTPSTRA